MSTEANVCPDCGAEKPDPGTPCGICAAAAQPIGAAQPAPAQPSYKDCPTCGAQYAAMHAACPTCAQAEAAKHGAVALPPAVCPVCTTDIPQGAQRCPGCDLDLQALAASGYQSPAPVALPAEEAPSFRRFYPRVFAAAVIVFALGLGALIVAAVEQFVPERKPSVRPEPRRAGEDPYDVSPFRTQSAAAAEPSRAEDAPADRSWNARMKGVIVAPPLVARGIVLFGDCGGSLQAFRVEDGAAVWEQPLDLDGWVTGPMAAIGDMVAVATMGGTVYAVEIETGRVRTEKRFDERFAGGVAGIRNGVVVGAESGRVYALEWAESGWRVRWQAEAKGRIEGGAAVGGRRVWVGTTEGSLLAWDEASGTLRTEVRAQEGAFLAAPATDGTNVFACSASETDSQVICLERGGTVRWKSAVPGRVVFPAAFDRERVVVSSTSGVYAFRRGTGEIAWERRLDARPGAPVVADGRVWIGSYGTSVWSLDPTTGEVVERRPTHWYAPGAGVVVDGMWIFGGYDRWVYCVDTAKAGG